MPGLFKNKIFTHTFLLLILTELLSFLGYYYPLVDFTTFFLIVILTIAVSLYRLEYGLYMLLAELFIGSFGYLFYFESGGSRISVRLALWLIIMSVWLAKTATLWLKTKKLSVNFLKSRYFACFMALSIFIAWGLINGFLNGNAASNIFFDFNNWLYFLLIFPIFFVLQNSQKIEIAKRIFLAAITWLSLKTIILAYFFSHNFNGFAPDLYRWIRESGVGEITQVQTGFSRIFMQSHIFVLIGFFILLFYLLKYIAATPASDYGREQSMAENRANKKSGRLIKPELIKYLGLPILFLASVIISFSRSFWIGLAAGGVCLSLVALFILKIKFKKFIIFNSMILFVIFSSFVLIVITVKFPYPAPFGGFDPALIISQRATQITDEAGAASRWQLLAPLWQKIKTAPIMGLGFGATVTYKTNDPRVLASNPGGLYTTYAFEWGWLDIWLKLGLFGLLASLGLLAKIIKDSLKINSYFSLSLSAGLVVLMAVNIFSPYINHPLGIGYLLITACLMDFLKIQQNKKPQIL